MLTALTNKTSSHNNICFSEQSYVRNEDLNVKELKFQGFFEMCSHPPVSCTVTSAKRVLLF